MLILLLLFLLFIEFPWSVVYDQYKNVQDPVSFSLFNSINNNLIKIKHQTFKEPLNVSICSENLLLFDKIMKQIGIKYWLSEGTALGVIRDNAFIPWDDDVDTSFMYNYRDTFIEQAFPLLKKEGFTLGHSFNHGNFITFHRKGEKIDVDIVEKDGKCVASMTKNANTNECNNILPYLNNMRTVSFLGTTFDVPGDDYLEFLYSKNWKTPQKIK